MKASLSEFKWKVIKRNSVTTIYAGRWNTRRQISEWGVYCFWDENNRTRDYPTLQKLLEAMAAYNQEVKLYLKDLQPGGAEA